MAYPLEKYKFYTDNKTIVVACAKHRGKIVKGIAKCASEDTFDLEYGKSLAAARCNLKVASIRLHEVHKAQDELDDLISSLEADYDILCERACVEWSNLRSAAQKMQKFDKN